MNNRFKILKRISLILFFILLSASIFGQTVTDLQKIESSLSNLSENEKLATLCQLANGYLSFDPKKSIEYSNQAVKLAKKLKNKESEAEALNILGAAYSRTKDLKQAASAFEAELAILEKNGEKMNLARSMFNLASIYRSLEKPKKAVEYYERSFALANSFDMKDLIYSNTEALFNTYYDLGKFKESIEYFKKYVALRESKLNSENNQKTQEASILVSKYESLKIQKEKTEKVLDKTIQNNETLKIETSKLKVESVLKDQEIEQLNYEKAFKEEEIRNKVLQRNSLIVASIFILVIAFLLFNRFLMKKKANIELSHRNEQIMQANEEIQAQRDEIEVQRDDLMVLNEELKQQKEEIEAQRDEITEKSHIIQHKNEEITQSIVYALRIQRALLPPLKEINTSLSDSFVLYKPKDIVSGDFYWFEKNFMNNENKVMVAAADCTGHGVPGAFMSMIGIELLSNAASKHEKTGDILMNLNANIKISLRQNADEESTRDGMDIALCVIDTKNKIIEYSGANRPLWIIKAKSNEILEIKATKKAIGGFTENEQIFDYNNIQLASGDSIYLFSDGYVDQFGGKSNRKLMTKNFREILLSIQKLSMIEQKTHLDNYFENWRGSNSQIDDVMVIGVKL